VQIIKKSKIWNNTKANNMGVGNKRSKQIGVIFSIIIISALIQQNNHKKGIIIQ